MNSREPLASYPCWLYNASGPRMFKTAVEWLADDNTDDWFDSPALVPSPAEPQVPVFVRPADEAEKPVKKTKG